MAQKHVHIANRQVSMPNIAVDISQKYVHTINKQVDISNMCVDISNMCVYMVSIHLHTCDTKCVVDIMNKFTKGTP